MSFGAPRGARHASPRDQIDSDPAKVFVEMIGDPDGDRKKRRGYFEFH